MKRQRQRELPRFVVGALATAGASMANGATVQITFVNNTLSNAAGGGTANFQADLTGDAVSDAYASRSVLLGGAKILSQIGGNRLAYISAYIQPRYSFTNSGARRIIDRDLVVLKYLGDVAGWSTASGTDVMFRRLVNMTFSDARVRNGELNNALLDVSVSARIVGEGAVASIQIHRLIFDDASPSAPSGVITDSPAFTEFVPVPEPSSLGLLALGAGGLLLRRRRAAA